MDYRDGVDLLTITENRSRTQQERKGKMRKKICVLLLSVLAITATPHTSWGYWDPNLAVDELVTAYYDAVDSGYGDQILNSYDASAACSAIWEIYVHNYNTDETGEEQIVPVYNDYSGDEAVRAAADICVNKLGFTPLRDNHYRLCPYNTSCVGDYMDAALGCMFVLVGDNSDLWYNDDRWGSLDWYMFGRDLMPLNEAADTLRNLFCTANDGGGGTFWDTIYIPDALDMAYLEDVYNDARSDNLGELIRDSYDSLPQCAAIYETYNALSQLGYFWHDYIQVPDWLGGGTMLPFRDMYWDYAVYFCTDVMGFDARRADNPCPDNTLCSGTWEDAFVGCMALTLGMADGDISEITELVENSLEVGYWYEDPRAYFCRGGGDGDSEFWYSLINGPGGGSGSTCTSAARLNCERAAVILQILALSIAYTVEQDPSAESFLWDELFVRTDTDFIVHEILSRNLFGMNLGTFRELFGTAETAFYSIATDVVSEYFDCFTQHAHDLQSLYQTMMDRGWEEVAYYIDDILNECAAGGTSCPYSCNPVACQNSYGRPGVWGIYQCSQCPDTGYDSAYFSPNEPRTFVNQCFYDGVNGQGSNSTGTYEFGRGACGYRLDLEQIYM